MTTIPNSTPSSSPRTPHSHPTPFIKRLHRNFRVQKQREEGEEDQNKGGRGTAQLGGGGLNWWAVFGLRQQGKSVGKKEKGDCQGQKTQIDWDMLRSVMTHVAMLF